MARPSKACTKYIKIHLGGIHTLDLKSIVIGEVNDGVGRGGGRTARLIPTPFSRRGGNGIKATQALGRHLGGAVGAKALEGRPG